MASPRPARHRALLVPGYYDGYLQKQETKSKKLKGFWTVLRGNELFFQMTSRDPTYIEKISLDNFVSVENDESQKNSFILKLKSGDTKLQAVSLEAREEWKGFIHTVGRLEVPDMDFLPGQIHRLQDVLEEEVKRCQKTASSSLSLSPPQSGRTTPEPVQSDYDDVENDQLSCFYKISRVEAQTLLEKNVEFGNMLMRPSSDGQNLSISTLQALKNNVIVKHYRVRCADNGYVIEIEDGIFCKSRQEIVDIFIERTKGVLKPLEVTTDYEINLSIAQEDAESGELIHQKIHTATQSPTKTSTELGNPKEPLPADPKICQQAKPFQSNTLPALTSAFNKELNMKLMMRRTAMCD
ncbi:signal-transducing adaptor protein 1-like isoform X2 [Narcine bancroftii]|uniref:signal-transducing adaptor protein 1-like isoform X2 n=1 Tax=Narcine bancroftii TaxID=1343680 RepID=UPI003831194F